MYLFFDTETAGLPRNWKASHRDFSNWPRMVQIAWLQYDENGQLIEAQDFIIRPDGFTIPFKTAQIHGITTARALKEGVALLPVLETFNKKLDESTHIIAHNLSFDENIIGAEMVRADLSTALFAKKRICTMRQSAAFCQLPGSFGYKWPKLSELYYACFERGFEEAHNARADIQATADCFWELRRRGFW